MAFVETICETCGKAAEKLICCNDTMFCPECWADFGTAKWKGIGSRIPGREAPAAVDSVKLPEGAQPGEYGAVWLAEWNRVWIVVHHEEGSVVYTDEAMAKRDQDVFEQNTGARGLLVGPFHRSQAPRGAKCEWIDASTGRRCVLPGGHSRGIGYDGGHRYDEPREAINALVESYTPPPVEPEVAMRAFIAAGMADDGAAMLNHALQYTHGMMRRLANPDSVLPAMPAWDSCRDGDTSLPEDAKIDAAHPLETGRHDLYQEAMRLVGARHSKGGLVELVNWLLSRIEEVRVPTTGKKT